MLANFDIMGVQSMEGYIINTVHLDTWNIRKLYDFKPKFCIRNEYKLNWITRRNIIKNIIRNIPSRNIWSIPLNGANVVFVFSRKRKTICFTNEKFYLVLIEATVLWKINVPNLQLSICYLTHCYTTKKSLSPNYWKQRIYGINP